MIVLSLFDGGSCGQVALNNIGIKPTKYYASEVDKYAIQVTQHNWPDTIQLGDITKWRKWDIDWSKIDLVMGGSPCQGFSYAGKQLLFDDPRSALFFVYVDILNHIKKHNPDVKFLLENVQMKPIAENTISYYLGVDPVFINSSLVSAQSRKRLYWANWQIEQPEDKEITLADIIESGEVDKEKSYCIDANYHKGGSLKNYLEKSRRQVVVLNPEKDGKIASQGDRIYDANGIAPCLMANSAGGAKPPKNAISQSEKRLMVRENGRVKGISEDETGYRPYQGDDKKSGIQEYGRILKGFAKKSETLTTSNPPCVALNDDIENLEFRKLTVRECEKLQGLPLGYTSSVSNTQAYKIIGNGWQVDTIGHIFKQMDKPLKQQLRLEIRL